MRKRFPKQRMPKSRMPKSGMPPKQKMGRTSGIIPDSAHFPGNRDPDHGKMPEVKGMGNAESFIPQSARWRHLVKRRK